MGNYVPSPPPFEVKQLPEYIHRELRRASAALADNAASVFYRTIPDSPSLSAGVSANWKITGNVLRVSTSVTQTFTGLQRATGGNAQGDANREIVFLNVGTGVAVLKNQAAESSASNRFALTTDWQLSANAAATLWRDQVSARWRGINRTP